MRQLLPEGWPRPRGYSNGVVARGELVFVAGQVGWDADGAFQSDLLADQVRTALANVVAVLEAGAARPEHIVRMTWYVTDIEEYRNDLAGVGSAYRDVIGAHYPVMTLVEVGALVEPQAKVEIEVTAVVPDE